MLFSYKLESLRTTGHLLIPPYILVSQQTSLQFGIPKESFARRDTPLQLELSFFKNGPKICIIALFGSARASRSFERIFNTHRSTQTSIQVDNAVVSILVSCKKYCRFCHFVRFSKTLERDSFDGVITGFRVHSYFPGCTLAFPLACFFSLRLGIGIESRRFPFMSEETRPRKITGLKMALVVLGCT
jgi:hypothetical protein